MTWESCWRNQLRAMWSTRNSLAAQASATGVVLVEAELAGFAQRSLAKFQGLESRFTGAKPTRGSRPSGVPCFQQRRMCVVVAAF